MKYVRTVSIFIVFSLISFGVSAQTMQSLEVGSNPSIVVRLGDPVKFSVTAYNAGSALGSTEIEINAPVGWEITSANPSIKPGSLSGDKRTARVEINVGATSNLAVNFYLKPLCTSVPEEGVVTYNWYKESTLLAAKSTQVIGNFIDPIIRFTTPADQNNLVANQAVTRVWSIEQTAENSYFNHLTIEAACNKATLALSKIEIVDQAGTTVLQDITSTALDAAQVGKYIISLSGEDFKKVGNNDSKLDKGEIIYIRETYILTDCSSGTTAYRLAYGDGTNICEFTSAVNVAAVIAQPGYNHDIETLRWSHVTSTGGNGTITFLISNNSTDLMSNMYNVLVEMYNSDKSHYSYVKAYFSDASGNRIAGLPDISLDNTRNFESGNKVWQARFDMLPNIAGDIVEQAKYEAIGLSDLDGDGVWDDLAAGKNVIITVEFTINFDRVAKACSSNMLQVGSTRLAYLYYQNTCGVYQKYIRAYSTDKTSRSTNIWMGEFKYSEPRISLSNPNVKENDKVLLSIVEQATGNNNNGYAIEYVADKDGGTNEHRVYVKLPEGFEYDSSVGVKVNTTNATEINYTASTRELTFRTTIVNYGKTYYIGLKATSQVAIDKNIELKHIFKNALGVNITYACYTKPVIFEQKTDCNKLELTSFEVERTTFGWTDKTETVKASKVLGADYTIAGPYDNVSMIFTINVKSNITLAADEKLYAEVTYIGENSDSKYYFVKDRGATLRYKKNGSSDFVVAKVISKENIIQGYDASKHSLKVDLSSHIGVGEYIAALGEGDIVEVTFLTQTNEYLPYNLAYVSELRGDIYTKLSDTKDACNGLYNNFRIVNYRLGSIGKANNNVPEYNINTDVVTTTSTNKRPMIMRYWMSCTDAPDNYFKNEWRPNAHVEKVKITINSLLDIEDVYSSDSGVEVIPTSDYNVTYFNGATTIEIIGNVKHQTYFNKWTGHNFYAKWQTICWSSQDQTISIESIDYPTSEKPISRIYNDAPSSLNLNATNYAYTLTCNNPSISPIDNQLEWELLLTNRSVWANTDPNLPNSWIGVDVPAGIVVTDLIDLSTNTSLGAPDSYTGGYWWKIGDQSVSSSKRFKLVGEYTSCAGSPVLKARYGMSKVTYPTDPAQGYKDYNSGLCNATTPVNLTFTPPTVNFSGELKEQGANFNGNFVFCDPVTFEATFTNGTAAKVYNPQLKVKLPTGVEWAGEAKVKQGSGGYVAVPASSITESTGEVLIKLDANMVLDSYQTGGNADATAVLEFKLRTTCGFVSGTAVYADFIGHNGCGTATTKNANSGNIDIEGISGQIPSYTIDESTTIVGSTPFTAGPNGKVTISGSIKLISANATPNDYIFIDIPSNLQLTSPGVAPNLVFTQVGDQIKAKLPGNGVFLDESTFSVELTPQNLADWKCNSHDIIFKYGIEKELPCSTVPEGKCMIVGYGDNTVTKSFTVQKQQLTLSDISFNGTYKDSGNETVTFTGKVINPSASAANMSIAIYVDNNGNGIFDAGDTPATGSPVITVSSIPAGGDKTFSQSFDIATSEICKLMLVAKTGVDNPYLCDDVVAKPSVIGYSIAQLPSTVCQGSDITIGDPAITGYTYSWSSSYITGNTLAQPIFNYPASENIVGSTTIISVPVTITRSGGCTATANASVTVEALPKVSISTAIADEPEVAGVQGNLVFTLTLEGNKCSGGGVVSVTCTTRDGKAKDTDGDYIAKTEVITFGASETSKTFTVKILGDNVLEGAEDMYVDLSVPVGCKIETVSAMGTINDSTNGTIMVEDNPINASEPDKPGKFRIRFVNSLVYADHPVYVTYSTAPIAVSLFSIPVTSTSPITIPAFQNGVDVVVEPIDNYVVEGDSRTVTLTIESVYD